MSSLFSFSTTDFIPPANVSQFQWFVILGGFACFAMALGIGANDVANCFGTSVGSKAITLKQAVIIASIFEFLGALILGASVTSTVRSGITNFEYFQGEEALLMLGMFSALISAALWLALATKYGLPVSTTQSIVGSIIGFTIIEKGPNAIYWDNVYQIIIWWLCTPLTAAIFVNLLFIPIRKYLLRDKQESYSKTLRFWPCLVFLVIFVMTIFLCEKGVKRIDISFGIEIVIVIAFGIGALCAFASYFIFIRTEYVHRFVQLRCQKQNLKKERLQKPAQEMSVTPENGGYGALNETDDFENGDTEKQIITVLSKEKDGNGLKDALLHGMNVDILADLSKTEQNIRAQQEQFDPQTEESFAWLQVLAATFSILAHGSNDVANAVAPFAAMIGIFLSGGVTEEVEVQWWILALGGAGMSLGLAMFGYKVIKSLGARMAAMSCSRGYCIQLSSATTIILASYYGQPASSTHAQVGATVGCGLLELANPESKLKLSDVVNWKLLIQTFFGWIMTFVVSGLTSAAIFSLFAYSPAHPSVCR